MNKHDNSELGEAWAAGLKSLVDLQQWLKYIQLLSRLCGSMSNILGRQLGTYSIILTIPRNLAVQEEEEDS